MKNIRLFSLTLTFADEHFEISLNRNFRGIWKKPRNPQRLLPAKVCTIKVYHVLRSAY